MEILVTGATGVVGRPLVDSLVKAGAFVRAVTRDALSIWSEASVTAISGDPGTPDTLAEALVGVDALFLHPRAVGQAAGRLLEIAKSQGVKRVVVLSATNVEEPLEDQPSRYNGDHNREVEAAALASGLECISLRASYFATNAIRSWAGQIITQDTVYGPYAEMAEAPIDPADLGEIAARALLTDYYVGETMALTGPASITHAEMVQTIGQVLGRPLRYVEVPPDHALEAMTEGGLPVAFVEALLRRYAKLSGRPAQVSTDGRRVLGRPPCSFADWAKANANAFQPAAAARIGH